MNARINAFSTPSQPPHGDQEEKEGSLGSGGSRIAGSRRLPLFPLKKEQTRAELFHRKKLTVHSDFPLKDIACVLLAQTKDAKIVRVIGCQVTRTWIHTLLKHLANARHDNKRKTVPLPECTLLRLSFVAIFLKDSSCLAESYCIAISILAFPSLSSGSLSP